MDRRQLLQTTLYGALLSGLGACASNHNALTAWPETTPAWPSHIQKIAFGSCINQNKEQPIWQAVLANRPDLFIFGGDTVYAD
ncbi:MAG: hypothetical protein ACKOD8_01910, partial [Limnohabitans sp.]